MDVPSLLANTREIKLDIISERESAIGVYQRILMAVVRTIRKGVRENVLPDYTNNLVPDVVQDRTRRRVTKFAVVNAMASIAISEANDKMELLFAAESKSHLVRVIRSIKKNTGIDVSPALGLSADEVEDLVKLYIERNAALIQSLSDDLVNKVEQAVYQAKIDRTTYYDLTKILQKQYGIAENRAALIAVDQLGSINSDFTRSRHEALGIDSYRWRTRHDGRVRPLHQSLNGNIYKWSESTGAEGGLHAGKPIRCRCSSVAVIPATPESKARNEKLKAELTKSNTAARARAKANRRR